MGRDMVSIKGTRNGLVIVLDPNREFDEIRKNLLNKMESARGFFKGARFSFFQGHNEIPTNQKNELENICIKYGLVPNMEKQATFRTEFTETPRKPARSISRCDQGEAALMIRRSLRSGQRISYMGHVVVLGDVHPGAEVLSGGNILVMGSCRGNVHAGAEGNTSAKVIAWRLSPTVLSIANCRYIHEQELIPREYRVARISDRKIVFEKYHVGRWT